MPKGILQHSWDVNRWLTAHVHYILNGYYQ